MELKAISLKSKKAAFWIAFNPSTWIFLSAILAVIAFLTLVVNPVAFAQAAMAFGVFQTVLASIAALTLIAGVCYTIIHSIRHTVARRVYMEITSIEKDKLLSEEKRKNLYSVYLSERASKIREIPAVMMLWLLFLGLIVVTLGLTIAYFAKGMVLDSFMGHILNFMSQAFFTIVHAMAGLPGLGFLNGLSDVTLLLVGQIFSAVMLNVALFFITDNISRVLETVLGTPSPWDEAKSELRNLLPETIHVKSSDESDDSTHSGPLFKALGNNNTTSPNGSVAQPKALVPGELKVNMKVQAMQDRNVEGQLSFKAGDTFTVDGWNNPNLNNQDHSVLQISVSVNGKKYWVPASYFCEAKDLSNQNFGLGGSK
jgi:hypothetical protein